MNIQIGNLIFINNYSPKHYAGKVTEISSDHITIHWFVHMGHRSCYSFVYEKEKFLHYINNGYFHKQNDLNLICKKYSKL